MLETALEFLRISFNWSRIRKIIQRAACGMNLFPGKSKHTWRHAYQMVHKQQVVTGMSVHAQKSEFE